MTVDTWGIAEIVRGCGTAPQNLAFALLDPCPEKIFGGICLRPIGNVDEVEAGTFRKFLPCQAREVRLENVQILSHGRPYNNELALVIGGRNEIRHPRCSSRVPFPSR